MQLRIGNGYDIHRLVPGRALILGGQRLEHPAGLGLDGHSDADVLVHAIMDALLGALSLGDIGLYFPPDDPQWQGADSLELLEQVVAPTLRAKSPERRREGLEDLQALADIAQELSALLLGRDLRRLSAG